MKIWDDAQHSQLCDQYIVSDIFGLSWTVLWNTTRLFLLQVEWPTVYPKSVAILALTVLHNPWKIGVFSWEIILYTVIKAKANWWAYGPLWSFSPLAPFLREQSFRLHTFPIIDYRKGSAAHSYEISLYSEDVVHLQLLTWLKKNSELALIPSGLWGWLLVVTLVQTLEEERIIRAVESCWVSFHICLLCWFQFRVCFVKPRYILPPRLGWV